MFEEAREIQVRMQDDLETAKEIQRQLLPSGPATSPDWTWPPRMFRRGNSAGISTIYCHMAWGAGHCHGGCLGKGHSGGAVRSLAIGILRELVVDREASPAEMLGLLNGRLLAARLDARFIAMHFAVYDAALRELSIANAGGTLPLLIRDGIVTELDVRGVPLGLLPETEYDESQAFAQSRVTSWFLPRTASMNP